MNELERHIEILLLSNDCVIVPGLGGFMAHHVDARYDEHDGMFVPPIRTLGFNPQLKLNDSLLVQSYIEAYDISYPEALRRIEAQVAELRSRLDTDGRCELNGLGVLSLNDEGNLEFDPCEAGILTPQLYGLGAFAMPRLQKEAREVELHDRTQSTDEGVITIKMSWLRNALAAAAAVAAFFMIGTPVANSYDSVDRQQSSIIGVQSHRNAADAAKGETSGTIGLAEADETTKPAETAEVDAPAEPTEAEPLAAEDGFVIVMASQVSERNAQAFVASLQRDGYADAQVLVSGAKHIRRVVCGHFATEAEASEALRQLRTQSRLFSDSWVMSLD